MYGWLRDDFTVPVLLLELNCYICLNNQGITSFLKRRLSGEQGKERDYKKKEVENEKMKCEDDR